MTDQPTRPQNLTLLGATGSIGCSTLEVIRANPERFRLFAVSARTSAGLLASIIEEFRPTVAVLSDGGTHSASTAKFAAEVAALEQTSAASGCELIYGNAGLLQIASAAEVDIVVAGIVGAAGLDSVFAAAKAGKRILLANKEALVMSGAVLMETVRRGGATLLPIDSEHNAIFQCLPEGLQRLVSRGHAPPDESSPDTHAYQLWSSISTVHLTASGGPFRGMKQSDLSAVTPVQACRHPNWQMGQKISVDSATLMNKGLEMIEACWLFDLEPERINVVVHPESIIHSMVEYLDGSVLAQLGAPDMKVPIASALGWPARISSRASRLDLYSLAGLHFEAPDHDAFPCLGLAGLAFEIGGAGPAVLNAANEVAVQHFLDGDISFIDIAKVIRDALDSCIIQNASTLEDIVDADARSRACAESVVARLS